MVTVLLNVFTLVEWRSLLGARLAAVLMRELSTAMALSCRTDCCGPPISSFCTEVWFGGDDDLCWQFFSNPVHVSHFNT